jgi:Family of unknown function (DUF6326)
VSRTKLLGSTAVRREAEPKRRGLEECEPDGPEGENYARRQQRDARRRHSAVEGQLRRPTSAADEQRRGAHMTAETKFAPSSVNVRIKISALWTSMLFVFAYVDLFSLYRRDFRADLEAGEVGGFMVNQSFLLGTTVYVVIPSLMVFCALVLRPRVDRIANIALGIVYALTVIAGAIGEWNYYVLGSAVEVALLAAVVYYAWTWPRETPPTS